MEAMAAAMADLGAMEATEVMEAMEATVASAVMVGFCFMKGMGRFGMMGSRGGAPGKIE